MSAKEHRHIPGAAGPFRAQETILAIGSHLNDDGNLADLLVRTTHPPLCHCHRSPQVFAHRTEGPRRTCACPRCTTAPSSWATARNSGVTARMSRSIGPPVVTVMNYVSVRSKASFEASRTLLPSFAITCSITCSSHSSLCIRLRNVPHVMKELFTGRGPGLRVLHDDEKSNRQGSERLFLLPQRSRRAGDAPDQGNIGFGVIHWYSTSTTIHRVLS